VNGNDGTEKELAFPTSDALLSVVSETDGERIFFALGFRIRLLRLAKGLSSIADDSRFEESSALRAADLAFS
jgi:hypothetical protein